jgi:uncharacterized OB-fold protein
MEIGVLRRDGRTDAFFDGAAAGRLVIKRCGGCAKWYAPDASECPECAGELGWATASGRATLVSWAISHGRPRQDDPVPVRAGPISTGPASTGPASTGPASTGPAPVVLALVELAEGPWLHSRLTEVGPADLRAGLPLRAHFEHPDEGESYLVFRSARGWEAERRSDDRQGKEPRP